MWICLGLFRSIWLEDTVRGRNLSSLNCWVCEKIRNFRVSGMDNFKSLTSPGVSWSYFWTSNVHLSPGFFGVETWQTSERKVMTVIQVSLQAQVHARLSWQTIWTRQVRHTQRDLSAWPFLFPKFLIFGKFLLFIIQFPLPLTRQTVSDEKKHFTKCWVPGKNISSEIPRVIEDQTGAFLFQSHVRDLCVYIV